MSNKSVPFGTLGVLYSYPRQYKPASLRSMWVPTSIRGSLNLPRSEVLERGWTTCLSQSNFTQKSFFQTDYRCATIYQTRVKIIAVPIWLRLSIRPGVLVKRCDSVPLNVRGHESHTRIMASHAVRLGDLQQLNKTNTRMRLCCFPVGRKHTCPQISIANYKVTSRRIAEAKNIAAISLSK